MAQQQQSPKVLINQFYQRAKAEQPRYECEAAPVDGQTTRFICTLTLPAVTYGCKLLAEQVFQEEGRSKKAAQDAAAAVALRFLSEQPVYGSARPYEESLLRTLATRVLSPEGLLRDPEMHGAAAAAVAFHDGWLPLAALASSRLLRGWAKEYGGSSYGADVAGDPAALVELVRRELAAQAAAAVQPAEAAAEVAEGVMAEAEAGRPQDPAVTAARAEAAAASAAAAAALGLSLGPEGLSVRLPAEAAAAAPPSVIADRLGEEVVAAGGVATLVVIPADSSLPLREESLPARGSLLSRLAELLGCPSHNHLLQWGRVGHKAFYAADPRVTRGRGKAGSLQDEEACEATIEALSCAPGGNMNLANTHPPRPATAATAAAAPARAERSSSGMSAAASGPQQPGTEAAAGQPPADVAPAPAPTPVAGTATPTTSQQSMSFPVPAARARRQAAASSAFAGGGGAASATEGGPGGGGGGGGGANVSSAEDAGGNGGGGGCPEVSSVSDVSAGGGPLRPPAVQAPYRADSTLTLAVHRGAAAMDWEADGQNEVRGPEHPSGLAAHHSRDVSHTSQLSSLSNATAVAHGHHHRPHHHRPHAKPPPGPAPTPTPTPTPAHGGAGNGGAGGSSPSCAPSPRHPAEHPSLVTLPEPSLYSKLLLPPLPLLPNLLPPGTTAATAKQARTAVAAAAPPPPPLPPLAAVTVAGATAGTAVAAAEGPAVVHALPPTLAGEPLNVRATWLAGRPVYGTAVATTCRLSPTPQVRKNHHVMSWRSYGAADCWRSATAGSPAASYTRGLHAPVLLRGLPREYRGPSAWQGPSPRALLDAYCAAHPPAACARLQLRVADVDSPGEGAALMSGTNFLGLPYCVTAGPGPLDHASQQAALAALHRLQRMDAECLAGGGGAGGEGEGELQGPEQGAPGGLPGGWRGQADPPLGSQGAEAGAGEAEQAGAGGAATAAAAAAAVVGVGSAEAGAADPAEAAEAAPLAGGELWGDGGGGVAVLEAGLTHARQPQEGALAKISYTIYLEQEEEGAERLEAGAEAPAAAAAPASAPPPSPAAPTPTTTTGPAAAGTVLERHAGLTLCVGAGGAGAVPPQVDAAVRRLRVGGRAVCRLPVLLEGCCPLSPACRFPALPARCELRLLTASLPLPEGGRAGAAGPALFTPPLGQQRIQAVAAALRREGAASLVDLGCGECSLLEGLLLGRHGADCGGPLRAAAGVDISRRGLAAAARRLGRLRAAAGEVERLPLQGEESAPQPVRVSLYSGSALSPRMAPGAGQAAGDSGAGAVAAEGAAGAGDDPWVGLRGCDAAVMSEVVEHLDPEPLSLVGPCVLGGLRPRLLLLTTPNWEYNAVMRACERIAAEAAEDDRAARRPKGGAGGAGNDPWVGGGAGGVAPPPGGCWPGPPGRDGLPLRCGDHRFEWSREEFRSWCRGLAGEWGYEVSFQEIGHANSEAAALQHPAYTGPRDPGGATQMATFTRREGAGGGAGGGVSGSSTAAEAVGGTGAVAAGGGDGGGGGGGGDGSGSGPDWELVWGPVKVAAPREELEEAEAAAEAADRGESGGNGNGGGGGGGRAGAKRGGAGASGHTGPAHPRPPKRNQPLGPPPPPAAALHSEASAGAIGCGGRGCGSSGGGASAGEVVGGAVADAVMAPQVAVAEAAGVGGGGGGGGGAGPGGAQQRGDVEVEVDVF